MLELGLVLVSGALFFLSACVLGALASELRLQKLLVCAGVWSCHKLVGNAILAGANNVAVAFGPAIGARLLSYQVAAPIAAVCAALGVILFGEPF